MKAFTGRCLVHRAEILELQGSWRDALDEAQQARQRFAETNNRSRIGFALYREAELQRLLGEFDAAEQAYRAASRAGWEPQPGLAQLRLVTVSSINRVPCSDAPPTAPGRAAETTEPIRARPPAATLERGPEG